MSQVVAPTSIAQGTAEAPSPVPSRAGRRVGKNVALLVGSVALNRLSTLLVFSVVAHQLGVAPLGTLGVVSAYTAYWFVLTDGGLSQRLVRDGAATPDSLRAEFAASLNLKFVGMTLPAASVVVLLLGWGNRPTIQLGCLLTGAMCLQSLAYTFESAARARELNKVEAISTAGQATTTLLLAAFLLLTGHGVVAVGVATLAAAAVRLLLSYVLAYRWVGVQIGRGWEPALLRRSAPYLITTVTATAYVGIDVAIIGLVTQPALVGAYISISRPLLALGFLVNYASAAAIPASVRLFESSKARFLQFGERLMLTAMLVAGALAALVAGFAKPFLLVLYGHEFLHSADLLRFTTVYLPITCANAVAGLLLTAAGRQHDRAVAVFVGLVATVGLCVVLVPSLHSTGASLQFVLSELVVHVIAVWRLSAIDRLSWRVRPMLLSYGCLALAVGLLLVGRAAGISIVAAVLAAAGLLAVAYRVLRDPDSDVGVVPLAGEQAG